MALVLENISNKPAILDVIAFCDESVKCTREEYTEIYLDSFQSGEGGDESILRLEGNPTRFKISLELSYEKEAKLTRNETKFEKGQMVQSGTYLSEQFRMCFVGIENPVEVPLAQRLKFKRHNDGGASIEVMDVLKRADILQDIMAAWMISVTAKRVKTEESGELNEEQEKKS